LFSPDAGFRVKIAGVLALRLVRAVCRRGADIGCVASILLVCVLSANAGSTDQTPPLTADRVQVLAAAYAHRFICICAIADQPMRHADYWEIPINTSSLGHSSGLVRIDRRTGEVSYPGERSASIGEIEAWLKEARKRKK
jgi:hypothetical protein